MNADALVVVSPVYKASYTGLLKAFFDRLPGGSLTGVPCVPAMLGGSERHALAVEVHLRPLLAELGADTLPGCYVTEAEMDDVDSQTDGWWERARHSVPRVVRLEVEVADDRR
jgi:FMN reductase